MTDIIMRDTQSLKPHPRNLRVYGRPEDNDQYIYISADMRQRGFDPDYPLLIIQREDGEFIIGGVTRWTAANNNSIEQCPCRVFKGEDWEVWLKIVTDNGYWNKTRLQQAREQQLLVQIEKLHAHGRMGKRRKDEKPSKSAARVALSYRCSGQTVRRNVRIVNAIDKAEAKGDATLALKLTDKLQKNQVKQALALLGDGDGKIPPRKSKEPRTLLDHGKKAHSEFFEACHKVKLAADLKVLEKELAKMANELEAARRRLSGQQPVCEDCGSEKIVQGGGSQSVPYRCGEHAN
jgi:hypothetical protein